MTDTFTLTASDGVGLVVHRWLPADDPRAIVQILHGASEHAGRYARLAQELNAAGYAVYAADHRGHGKTAGALDRFGIAGEDTWSKLVSDAREVTEHIAREHPDVPIVLLGHSMGSMVAQGYLVRGTGTLAAAVLTGTAGTFAPEWEGLRERLAAAIATEGRDVPSMEFAMLFANFNDPFVDPAAGEAASGFEWLSRDPAEVQRYVDDPWCGNPLTNGFVDDLAVGLEEIWTGGGETNIPDGFPVLLMNGSEDPVGENGASIQVLVERYRRAGLAVTDRLYDGARHEVFNEANRDEISRDLLEWLDRTVASAGGAERATT